MKEKKLRRLGRADLVEILYRQRELIDQLDEQNRRLQERAEKAVALAGGADAVLRAAEEAVRKGECQWCLELCDLLLTIGVNAEAARRQKAVALTKLAAYETSANGRHYYLVCAHELENRH